MRLDDLFGEIRDVLDPKKCTCHSGGAVGADTVFEETAAEWGVKTRAYSYKTKYHNSPNKVEISKEDYDEGVDRIGKANRRLGRNGIARYMNLLARNWSQVKYSSQVFAIGTIIDPGAKDEKGYKNKWSGQIVSGGTGYAVMMGVMEGKDVYVFDQTVCAWHRWSEISEKFVRVEPPVITSTDFAGIGTRNLSEQGEVAIKDLFDRTFSS